MADLRRLSGDWNPHDAARFISPEKFNNTKALHMPRGNRDHTTLPSSSYSPTWRQWSVRGGFTYLLPLDITAGVSYTGNAGPWFGIFKKIQAAMGLLDARHSILELSKGKLTTDPAHHSGEGIFFSSRMFDLFTIISEGLCFTHVLKRAESRITEVGEEFEGTSVEMRLQNYTDRTTRNVFDEYASGDDYGFTKTVVPVRLAQYGKDKLVSRSQARRVLARLELFKIVLFDFTGVEAIGQAFADEMFRVFAMQHPEIKLVPVGANAETKWMIARATRKRE